MTPNSFGIPFPTALTSYDLLTRGYFHDRVIPPLHSGELHKAFEAIQSHIKPILQKASKNGFRLKLPRSRPAMHSVPKRKHLRRVLTIPNPLPYAILCDQVSSMWPTLESTFYKSSIGISIPTPSTERALMSLFAKNEESLVRARASVGARFLLQTDLVRFYPSIYTHSIPWAIHGKEAARADTENTLIGNRLDACIRELQDRQTGGIPIGPDVSFLVGEIIASRIDAELAKLLQPKKLMGTRYIDDYHLYFGSRSEAEEALAALHQVARMFELEINDLKTEIKEVPEVLEPKWKADLRAIKITNEESEQAIIELFDRATEYANAFPFDSVFTYVAKKLLDEGLSIELWTLAERMLLRTLIAEPSMMSVLAKLFDVHGVIDKLGLANTLNALCLYHAPLQQGYEVAWALWIACATSTGLSESTGRIVAQVDDDIVALVALDLNSRGLLPLEETPLWRSRMTQGSLYSEHWLLSYEALRRSWLPSKDGSDYLNRDAFFSVLAAEEVSFYDPSGKPTGLSEGYEG